jgi:NAD(P)-dependent dehydrogenase (short-subunit alcohol dehydrogenase family)
MSQNQQPVCAISGGSAGIGLAIGRRFAALGYRMAICGRDAGKLEAAGKLIEADGAECLTETVDLQDGSAAGRWIEAVRQAWGRIDVLVNNAGKAPLAPVDAVSDEVFRQTLAVNVEAVFHATKAVWPVMRGQGGGVIVNISSLASVDPFTGFSVYGACKAWVNLFTKAIADEGKPVGIRAFSVALGAVETDMLRGLFPDFPGEQTLTPEEVADFVAELCDRSMTPMTGQTLFFKK